MRARVTDVKNKLSVRTLLSKLNQPPELSVENCAGIYPDGAPLFDSLATAKVHELKGNATVSATLPPF